MEIQMIKKHTESFLTWEYECAKLEFFQWFKYSGIKIKGNFFFTCTWCLLPSLQCLKMMVIISTWFINAFGMPINASVPDFFGFILLFGDFFFSHLFTLLLTQMKMKSYLWSHKVVETGICVPSGAQHHFYWM